MAKCVSDNLLESQQQNSQRTEQSTSTVLAAATNANCLYAARDTGKKRAAENDMLQLVQEKYPLQTKTQTSF